MKKTILTVDDSPSIRQMVNFTLKEAGYDVIEASNGKEALNKIEQHDFNMIFTDLNMPVMDGLELIKEVRLKPKYRFIPIIMLTTESQLEKKSEGKKAGATGWIVKPFNPEQLIGVTKKVLR
ncbi:MAG: response regulator [Ignavibacteria bacterium]|jgi:two-component system chemotaxis response regulator CheY